MANNVIPVYLITGFLEAGKTSFMQETLSDPGFHAGERTLVLLCEEGEVELDTSEFPTEDIFIETIDSQEQLNAPYLASLAAASNPFLPGTIFPFPTVRGSS